MQVVSDKFAAAAASSNRSSLAIVLFSVVDVTAADDATFTANTTQPFTTVTSLTKELKQPAFKMASFEPDRFRLDGTFFLAPDDVNTTDNLGWWSSTMSGPSGVFTTYPMITITFTDTHSSLGIGIFFGTDDYVTDFTVAWYNGSTILSSIDVIGNTAQDANVENQVENYNKIIIYFKKTRRGFRYARVMQIAFGLEEYFDNDLLIDAAIIEELDPSGAYLSVNKLNFTVLNTDNRFNMLNPDGIYAFLQRRQKITAQSGLIIVGDEAEYVPLGTYYLSDWKNADGLTATLEATDAIGLMDKTQFWASPFWVNEPIINVVNKILSDVFGTKYTLIIDPAILTEVVNGFIEVKSHREALMDVLVATRCSLRIERDGTFHLMRVDYSTVNLDIDNNVIIGQPVLAQKPIITSVETTEYSFQAGSVTEDIYNSSFPLSGTQTMVIPFDSAASSPSLTVTSGGTVIGTPQYSAVAVKVTIAGSGNVAAVITGKKYIETKRLVTVNTADIPPGEIAQTATLDSENRLVVGKGQLIAQYVLDYYQKRIKQTFEFWANPAMQSGDNVTVETIFGGNRNGVVEKQDLQFAPILRSRVEVTG